MTYYIRKQQNILLTQSRPNLRQFYTVMRCARGCIRIQRTRLVRHWAYICISSGCVKEALPFVWL